MTEAEIKAGLVSLDPGHGFVRSLKALLDQAVDEEQDNVTVPNLADGARHFNAGRLAHAKDFRQAFVSIIEEAQREAAARLAQAKEKTGE